MLKPVMLARYGLHSLRHFCISNWIAGQVWDLKTIQTHAGHSSLKVTTDTYGHFIPQDDAHDRLADAEAKLAGGA